MYIYPKTAGTVGPSSISTNGSAGTSQTENAATQPSTTPISPASTSQSDSVDISDAGRALAAHGAQSTGQATTLDPARASQIRQRVLSGAYDTLGVVDAVARRVMASGDL